VSIDRYARMVWDTRTFSTRSRPPTSSRMAWPVH